MEPAASIIKLLGGEAVVTKVTGLAYTAPYRWQHSEEKGGTAGFIPRKHHQALLDYAAEHGLPLKPEHFITGVPADVLEAARPAPAEPERAA